MKRFILLVAFSAISAVAVSQNTFGLSAGFGSSMLDNYRNYFRRNTAKLPADVVVYPYKPDYAWRFGCWTEFHHRISGLSTVVEADFVRLGARMPLTDFSSETESLNYLTIPLSLKYSPVTHWYVSGGLSLAVLIGKPGTAYNDPRAIDFGANLGFGVQLFPRYDLFVNFYHALTYMNNNHDAIKDADGRLYNRSLTVHLRVQLGKIRPSGE